MESAGDSVPDQAANQRRTARATAGKQRKAKDFSRDWAATVQNFLSVMDSRGIRMFITSTASQPQSFSPVDNQGSPVTAHHLQGMGFVLTAVYLARVTAYMDEPHRAYDEVLELIIQGPDAKSKYDSSLRQYRKNFNSSKTGKQLRSDKNLKDKLAASLQNDGSQPPADLDVFTQGQKHLLQQLLLSELKLLLQQRMTALHFEERCLQLQQLVEERPLRHQDETVPQYRERCWEVQEESAERQLQQLDEWLGTDLKSVAASACRRNRQHAASSTLSTSSSMVPNSTGVAGEGTTATNFQAAASRVTAEKRWSTPAAAGGPANKDPVSGGIVQGLVTEHNSGGHDSLDDLRPAFKKTRWQDSASASEQLQQGGNSTAISLSTARSTDSNYQPATGLGQGQLGSQRQIMGQTTPGCISPSEQELASWVDKIKSDIQHNTGGEGIHPHDKANLAAFHQAGSFGNHQLHGDATALDVNTGLSPVVGDQLLSTHRRTPGFEDVDKDWLQELYQSFVDDSDIWLDTQTAVIAGDVDDKQALQAADAAQVKEQHLAPGHHRDAVVPVSSSSIPGCAVLFRTFATTARSSSQSMVQQQVRVMEQTLTSVGSVGAFQHGGFTIGLVPATKLAVVLRSRDIRNKLPYMSNMNRLVLCQVQPGAAGSTSVVAEGELRGGKPVIKSGNHMQNLDYQQLPQEMLQLQIPSELMEEEGLLEISIPTQCYYVSNTHHLLVLDIPEEQAAALHSECHLEPKLISQLYVVLLMPHDEMLQLLPPTAAAATAAAQQAVAGAYRGMHACQIISRFAARERLELMCWLLSRLEKAQATYHSLYSKQWLELLELCNSMAKFEAYKILLGWFRKHPKLAGALEQKQQQQQVDNCNSSIATASEAATEATSAAVRSTSIVRQELSFDALTAALPKPWTVLKAYSFPELSVVLGPQEDLERAAFLGDLAHVRRLLKHLRDQPATWPRVELNPACSYAVTLSHYKVAKCLRDSGAKIEEVLNMLQCFAADRPCGFRHDWLSEVNTREKLVFLAGFTACCLGVQSKIKGLQPPVGHKPLDSIATTVASLIPTQHTVNMLIDHLEQQHKWLFFRQPWCAPEASYLAPRTEEQKPVPFKGEPQYMLAAPSLLMKDKQVPPGGPMSATKQATRGKSAKIDDPPQRKRRRSMVRINVK